MVLAPHLLGKQKQTKKPLEQLLGKKLCSGNQYFGVAKYINRRKRTGKVLVLVSPGKNKSIPVI